MKQFSLSATTTTCQQRKEDDDDVAFVYLRLMHTRIIGSARLYCYPKSPVASFSR